MKQRISAWLLVAALFGISGCNKKEPAEQVKQAAETAVEAVKEAAQKAVEEVTKPLAASAEERAAKLGFVRHLPTETESVIAYYDGTGIAKRVKESALWDLIQKNSSGLLPGAGLGIDEEIELEPMEQGPDAQPEEIEPSGPAALFAREVMLAFGSGTAEQTGHLLSLNERSSYFQMLRLVRVLATAVKSGSPSDLMGAAELQSELLQDVLNDEQGGIGLFEKMSMPPLTISFRAAEGQVETLAQQLSSSLAMLGMLGEAVVPVQTERAGQAFAGYKIAGAGIADILESERESLARQMNEAQISRLIAAVKTKDLVVLSGTVADYAVLFLGAAEDDFKLAESLDASFAASSQLTPLDAYLGKELAAIIVGDKPLISSLVKAGGGMDIICEGIRDGLLASKEFGDTRDLEALLKLTAERETALLGMMHSNAVASAAFFEDGLKIEQHGGADSGAIDWDADNALASLDDSGQAMLFASACGNEAYHEKLSEYLEAIVETAYAMALKVSELGANNQSFINYVQGMQLFETTFRKDVLGLVDALRGDFSDGLGPNSAFVIDLNGTVPPVPGLPQAFVDAAKFPRITSIRPVKDRAKLAASWDAMNSGATSLLSKASEMSGQEIPMQKPISSEKNGMTTWFFAMPFFNDEFMPSVTLDDKWFAMSTSRNQSLDLLTKAAAAKPGRKGFYLSADFDKLRAYLTETINLMEQHAEALKVDAGGLSLGRQALAAMEDLSGFTAHVRKEGREVRASLHLKTK